MGGIHSGGVGTILLYIGCPVGGAAHYMGGESTNLGYIEAPPMLPPLWETLGTHTQCPF